MLQIRIIHPGSDEVVHEIQGHQATLGRASDNDVVINEKYISGRHAKVLSGLIVLDLDSTNGTFVDGTRVREATVIRDGKFQLGGEAGDVRVRVTGGAQAGGGLSGTIRAGEPDLHGELSEARRERERLLRELDQHRSKTEETQRLVAEWQRERQDLQRRLDEVKEEIRRRDEDAAESLQAKLLQQELEAVRKENEALVTRAQDLEKRAGQAEIEATKAKVLQERVGQLESDRAGLQSQVDGFAKKLREAKEQAPAPDHFFKLQQEIQRLKGELEAAKSGDVSSGEVYHELRQENEALRRDLEKARSETVSATGPASSPQVAELEKQLFKERQSKADMLEELERLRSGASAAPAPTTYGGGLSGLALLRRAADEDVEGIEPDPTRSAAEFIPLELFRFAREGERVITRHAGSFIQLLDGHTVLPGMEGTLRDLTLAVIDGGHGGQPQQEFLSYMKELREWLVTSLQAYPRAAERYALELRDKLSEKGLTEKEPIPKLLVLGGRAEGEYWKRAQRLLQELSDETVRDRVQTLARECASDVMDV